MIFNFLILWRGKGEKYFDTNGNSDKYWDMSKNKLNFENWCEKEDKKLNMNETEGTKKVMQDYVKYLKDE